MAFVSRADRRPIETVDGLTLTLTTNLRRSRQPTRHELLFRGADNRMMFARYQTTGDSFRVDKPQLWSPRPLPTSIMRPLQGLPFDFVPGGERIALFVPPEPAHGERDKVVVMFNLFDELRQLGTGAH